MNMFGNNCNDQISAETLSMVKEHFILKFGIPVHTIGSGLGRVYAAMLVAQNYPGLLDGIIPALSFPDMASIITPVVDCSLLDNAFKHIEGTMGDEQKSAVAGFATWRTYETHWIGRENFLPVGLPHPIARQRFQRRPSMIARKIPPGSVAISTTMKSMCMGATRRRTLRAGHWITPRVSTGLTAFNAGKISAEQFVDLGTKKS